MQDELEVIRAALAGQEEAWTEIYRTHYAMVRNICQNILGHSEDVEDAIQESFLRVFTHLRTFKGKAKLSTWIYRVAFTTVLWKYTRPGKYRKLAGELISIDDVANIIPAPSADDRTIPLAEIWKDLRVKDRNLLVLTYLYGYEACELGETPSTVKSRIFRAKKNAITVLTG